MRFRRACIAGLTKMGFNCSARSVYTGCLEHSTVKVASRPTVGPTQYYARTASVYNTALAYIKKRIEPWLHAVPIVYGLAMGMASITIRSLIMVEEIDIIYLVTS